MQETGEGWIALGTSAADSSTNEVLCNFAAVYFTWLLVI